MTWILGNRKLYIVIEGGWQLSDKMNKEKAV